MGQRLGQVVMKRGKQNRATWVGGVEMATRLMRPR